MILSRLLLAGSLLLLAVSVHAAPDKGKAAVTEPSAADADFAWQGEYFGLSLSPEYAGQMTGLHVIALGDGKFDGVLYRGGLPGAGWDRAQKSKLTGQRTDESLVLQSADRRVVVTRGAAAVYDSEQRLLANLEKIHRVSPTLGLAPPSGATVLFDGSNGDHWDKPKIANGLLMAGTTTKKPVGDFRMHLEFRLPYMPYARGQGRGNSGVYIQRRYEVQILDSFGLEGVENECGGLYRQRRPLVNMCLPPLSWQTYDIEFQAARFADGKKTQSARLTVRHNGELIHDGYDIVDKTGAGQAEGPQPLPINLQDHGNPVTYRNIWLVEPGADVARTDSMASPRSSVASPEVSAPHSEAPAATDPQLVAPQLFRLRVLGCPLWRR